MVALMGSRKSDAGFHVPRSEITMVMSYLNYERWPERDAVARVAAAHDRIHVVAAGIQAVCGPALAIEHFAIATGRQGLATLAASPTYCERHCRRGQKRCRPLRSKTIECPAHFAEYRLDTNAWVIERRCRHRQPKAAPQNRTLGRSSNFQALREHSPPIWRRWRYTMETPATIGRWHGDHAVAEAMATVAQTGMPRH
jgi:hypothetical protein